MRRFSLSVLVFCLVSSFTGCGGFSGSTTNTPPTGTAAVTLSSTSLSFAATAVGTSSSSQTVTVTSSGTGTVYVAFTSVTLSDTTDYALTSNCTGNFGLGAYCTLTVTFTPRSAAALPATLSIADNVTGSPQTIALTGTGTAAPAPQAVLSPATAAYTSVITSASVQLYSGPTITLSNPGSASLAGIGISITGTGASAFSINPATTTCTTTLAAGATCSIVVRFVPTAVGTYNAVLNVADNASGSPQTVTLTGTATTPGATLSASTIAFPSTTAGSTSASSSVTLTNSGSASLLINGIALGGANPSAFASTNTCGTTLAVGASCTISATFMPTAAQAYGATLTVTDTALSSPQIIALTGTASTVTRTLYTFPATFPDTTPDPSVTALYNLVNNAQTSIDMTMYELVDTTFSGDLVSACARGVKVRVLLDASLEKSANTPAYNQLNTTGANCSAVFSNTAFQATHQKSMLIDGVTSVIMTLNLTSRYYSTTRDFALVENDPADYAAIEATFNSDYAAGTPYNGTQGASDFSYTPGAGDDLIWSPTTAQAAMLALINNATTTLLIENEELSSSTTSTIVAALTSACQRGVTVHFTIVDQSSYEAQFTMLKNAGCSVHTYANTSTGFYVHAKVVVADYGLSTQNVYMGSINYSSASMNQNRELGMYLTDTAAVQTLYSTLTADYNGGTAW